MAQHDNYEKDILKTLKSIASSLDKIGKHLENKNSVQILADGDRKEKLNEQNNQD